IKEGDVLAEIETDKATMELVARGSGILRKILLEDGGTAPVGSVIAVIAAEDEDISDILKSVPEEARAEAAPGPAAGAEPGVDGEPAEREAGRAAAELAASGATEPGQGAGGVRAADESPSRAPTPAVGTTQELA